MQVCVDIDPGAIAVCGEREIHLGFSTTASLGVGTAGGYPYLAAGFIDGLELGDTVERQRHRSQAYGDPALVGLFVDGLGNLGARHAWCDVLDIHEDCPGFGRRQRNVECVVDLQ